MFQCVLKRGVKTEYETICNFLKRDLIDKHEINTSFAVWLVGHIWPQGLEFETCVLKQGSYFWLYKSRFSMPTFHQWLFFFSGDPSEAEKSACFFQGLQYQGTTKTCFCHVFPAGTKLFATSRLLCAAFDLPLPLLQSHLLLQKDKYAMHQKYLKKKKYICHHCVNADVTHLHFEGL